MKVQFLILLLVVILGKSYAVAESEHNMPVAVDGIIDLDEWQYPESGHLKLDGAWEFYWHELIAPGEFADKKMTGYYPFPSYWNGQVIGKDTLSRFGYATARLIIRNKNGTKRLMLHVKELMTSYSLYYDGTLIASNGTVGRSRDESTPAYHQLGIPVTMTEGNHEIVLQVSNFWHRVGGYYDSIEIGEFQSMYKKNMGAVAFDLFMFGSILIMVLYHLGFFIFRRKDKTTLLFSLFAVLVAIRILFTGEQSISVFFPDFSFEWGYKLEYFTVWGAPTLFIVFFNNMFRNELPRWFFWFIIGSCCLLSVFTLVTPSYIYSFSSAPYQVFMIFGIGVTLISIIKAIRNKREGAILLLAGIIALFAGVINDILYVNGIFKLMELSPLGLYIFILCQSLVVSRRFTKTYNENERLNEELSYQNKNLEKIVERRTQEIMQQKEEIEAQAELLEEQNKQLEQLSIVASETENAVTIADEQGLITWVNLGFTKLYGYSLEEFIEKRGANIIKASFNSTILESFMDCTENNKSVVYTSKIISKDKTQKWIRTTLTPIHNEQGELYRLVAIDADISDLKMAEEEIKQRNEEILAQSELLAEKNEILEKNNLHIMQSISYARLIQEAILPTPEQIRKDIPESFIVFKPRDIVSGDFYWYKKDESSISIAVADCTGHGVPGAFMSMIGNTLLNQIVNEGKIIKPDRVLEELGTGVKYALGQRRSSENEQDDGMDISLCRIDLINQTLQLSMANHNCFVVKNGVLEQIKGDSFSIGGVFSKPATKEFTLHTFKLGEIDKIYLFSDGFQDQFGGGNNEKFFLSRMRAYFGSICNHTAEENYKEISETFTAWKGSAKQIDDVLIIGLDLRSISRK